MEVHLSLLPLPAFLLLAEPFRELVQLTNPAETHHKMYTLAKRYDLLGDGHTPGLQSGLLLHPISVFP